MVKELGILTLLVLLAVFLLPGEMSPQPHFDKMERAAFRMEKTLGYLRNYRDKHGPPFDEAVDPNFTGLIGVNFSPITTTLGYLETKRAMTNPNFAALMVKLLKKRNLGPGDKIAVSASGSFPAAYLAFVIAAEEIGLNLDIILSLGSSSWGANNPKLTIIDIERVLWEGGYIKNRSSFVSLGGSKDKGNNFWPGGMDIAEEAIERNNAEFWYYGSFEENIKNRFLFFQKKAPVLYVNIGGAEASLGPYPLNQKFKPGYNFYPFFPRPEDRGVAARFLEKNIPVFNILEINYFLERYNFPEDPVPLPQSGIGEIYWKEKMAFKDSMVIIFLVISELVKIREWKVSPKNRNLQGEKNKNEI